jgi:hypothetical protein
MILTCAVSGQVPHITPISRVLPSADTAGQVVDVTVPTGGENLTGNRNI